MSIGQSGINNDSWSIMKNGLYCWYKENKPVILFIGFIGCCLLIGWGIYITYGHQFIRTLYKTKSIGWYLHGGMSAILRHSDKYYLYPIDDYFKVGNVFFMVCTAFLALFAFIGLTAKKVHINLTLLVLSVTGISMILLATSHYGVGIRDMGVYYVSVARGLLSGHGYQGYDNLPMATEPPLLPTILAAFGLTGIDPLTGARFFNAVVFGLIIFISGRLFASTMHTKKLIIFGTIIVLFSVSLVVYSLIIATEPLFIVLALLCMIYLNDFLNKNRWPALVLAAAFTALACLQRYIGITLVATGFIAIMFFTLRKNYLQRLVYALAFCMISTAPLLVWGARNYMLSQPFFGVREPSDIGVWQSLYFTLDSMTAFFMPAVIPFAVRVIIGLMVFVGMLSVLFIKVRHNNQDEKKGIGMRTSGLWVLMYTVFLIYSGSVTDINKPYTRFLAVIFVFISLLLLICAEDISILLKRTQKNGTAATLIVFTVCGLLMVYPFTRCNLIIARNVVWGAVGYNEMRWRQSPLVKWIQTHSFDGLVYSNDPEAIYYFTGKTAQWIHIVMKDPVRIKKLLGPDDKTYLVWFNTPQSQWGNLHNVQDIRSFCLLDEIKSCDDGAVYLLTQ